MDNLPQRFSLGEATEKVLELKSSLSRNIIELGRWIDRTKTNLGSNTEWMDWLKYEVKIPYITAWRFMKIYRDVDAETLERVGFRKLIEILELPPSKFRENLMDLAPALTVMQIEALKVGEEIGGITGHVIQESIKENRDIGIALNSNALLLDALFRLGGMEIPEESSELLRSQLKETPSEVGKFLEGMNERPE